MCCMYFVRKKKETYFNISVRAALHQIAKMAKAFLLYPYGFGFGWGIGPAIGMRILSFSAIFNLLANGMGFQVYPYCVHRIVRPVGGAAFLMPPVCGAKCDKFLRCQTV